tara:strand:+ start:1230 stop:1541 length:312 start_codon:yes stop_codon:yes gene_type:complete
MRRVVEATVQNKIFTAEFVKQDGTVRKMNARLNVKKHLKKGVNCNTNTSMLPVYDLKSEGYRNINIETLNSITVDSIKHIYAEIEQPIGLAGDSFLNLDGLLD